MIWHKRLLGLTTVSLALPLGLILSPIAQSNPTQKLGNAWEISQAFQSPNNRIPPGTRGGGTRGSNSCANSSKPYMALVPQNQIGLTLEEYPKFFVYVPETESREIKLTLMKWDGQEEEEIGRVTFTTSGKPGIVSVSFPQSQQNSSGGKKFGLEVNQLYRWEIEIGCDPDDPSGNQTVAGWVERVSPTGPLANLRKNSTPADYAKNGIWYEALAGAAQLYKDKPNDPKVKADWETLLNSVGFSNIAKETVIDCCRIQSNTASQR